MADVVPLLDRSAVPSSSSHSTTPVPEPLELSFDASTEQILKKDIPWESYFSAKLISATDFQLLRRYDHKSNEMQAGLLEENGPAYVKTFLAVLRNVFKEDTAEYVLAMTHNLLAVNRRRIRFFLEGDLTATDMFDPLLRLLSSRNWYILQATTKLLSELIAESGIPVQRSSLGSSSSFRSSASSGPVLANGKGPAKDPEGINATPVIDTFVPWLADQLVSPAHPTFGVPSAVAGLGSTLRASYAREVFVRNDGIARLLPLVNPACPQSQLQTLYDSVLCMWLLSFNEQALEALKNTRAIKLLNDVAKASKKEKVVRVAVLALNNFLVKGNMGGTMVELGLPKTVQSLKLQTWHDEDLKDALDSLSEGLRHNLRVMSSFDKYRQEVLSGSLDWTPMHKDQAFWRENIGRFEDNEFQVLRVLVALLSDASDKRTLAVACYDLGQFINTHPSGRNLALDMKAKDRVMTLMADDDSEVRKQALLCIQKLLLSAKYVSFLQT